MDDLLPALISSAQFLPRIFAVNSDSEFQDLFGQADMVLLSVAGYAQNPQGIALLQKAGEVRTLPVCIQTGLDWREGLEGEGTE